MNIVQLEDDIKSLPDDRLMTEMQAPTGGFPQYLVLSEIKRRKQMRDDYRGRMAAHEKTPPRPTIAEETVQEGISSIMPSNMPQGAPPQGMPMAQGMPVNQPASIEGGGLESLMPQGMAGGGRTNRVMLGKTNYQDATLNPQGSGFFGLEGLDPSFFQQTEAEKAYQEMMLDYYSPERRKERDKFSRGMNMLRAGLAVGTARTPEQLSASMGPVIEGAIEGRATGEKEDLALAGAQAQMSKLERDRQLKLAELGIKAKQAEDIGKYYGKPDAFTVKTQIVRELAGSGPPGGKAGTSDNEFVVWEEVMEEGVPKLDGQGNPVLESTLTERGARFAGELSQQGTILSAEMRLEAQLWDQATKIVENQKGVMDIIEEPKAVLAEAIKTHGPNPTQEQLDEVKRSRKDRAIWDAVQSLKKSTRMQKGGGRVLSTPTPVGLPSIQQMLE
tara:strand:- start:1032 stop:2363 length:1332 start_codon:yes stop_codon:yes gene_type:complete